MNWKTESKIGLGLLVLFAVAFYIPVGEARFDRAVSEALALVKWYAREHVLLCLIPAFFIAGAITVFVKQDAVMKYLGAEANKMLAYGVASISGTILAVCSCTVLPLFAGIYRMGAGLGPAAAFLYSGPAINVLAIILTARVLGFELGIARVVGAVSFSIVIGLLMQLIFRRQESARRLSRPVTSGNPVARPLWQSGIYFGSLVGILVFANWSNAGAASKAWQAVYALKWPITGLAAAVLGVILVRWFGLSWWRVVALGAGTIAAAVAFPQQPLIPFALAALGLGVITATSSGPTGEWFEQTWFFTKQVFPLLIVGVLVAGFLLGRPGSEGMIPAAWVERAVGGNSLGANLFASIAGAFMYFATLTEIPILQGLIGSGMGKGPALALLLAGPALSLPSMLVLCSIMGTTRTLVYVLLVIMMATTTGIIYGAIF